MNGVHDMGGMHCYGPVVPEENEPIFHAPWEGRIFGMMNLTLGLGFFIVDQVRHSIERMAPASYLSLSYYEKWLVGFTTLLQERGLVTAGELDGSTAAVPLAEPVQAIPPEMVPAILKMVPPPQEVEVGAHFAVGDEVLVRNLNPPTHTRVAAYVRGKLGTIARDHGVYYLPDTAAHGQGEHLQHCYAARFSSKELWGEQGNDGEAIYFDLFDDYLDPV